MALWVYGLGRPDALPQCTILYYNELLSVMLFGAFLIAWSRYFLLLSAINKCLLRDFTLLARLEFDEKIFIFDDRNFLIKIISKLTFATENTAHINAYSIKFIKRSSYFCKSDKISEELVSVALCSRILLITTVRKFRKNVVQRILFKTFL